MYLECYDGYLYLLVCLGDGWGVVVSEEIEGLSIFTHKKAHW